LDVNISGPVNVYMDSKHNVDSVVFDDNRFKTSKGISDFVSGKKNIGLGLDLGATYELNDKIMISASVTDLGFIRWNKDITTLSADNTFEFSGLNMNDFFNGSKTINDIGKDMVDSLKNAFSLTKSKAAFTTYLPFGISVGGSYNLTKQFSVGLLSYSRIITKQFREAVTLSANLNIGNALSTSLSYTAANGQFNSLGAGLGFRAGVTQFYIVSDRIPLYWNKIKNDNSSFVLPANWNTFNFRIGMNLVFGNKVKEKSDKPMLEMD
jgi:hypothetical protein